MILGWSISAFLCTSAQAKSHDGQRSLPCVGMSRNILFTSLSRFLHQIHTNPVTAQITAAAKVHDTATIVVFDAEFFGFPFMEVGVGVAVDE